MSGEALVLRRTVPGFCLVRVKRDSACGKSCQNCSFCGDAPPLDIPARNKAGARPGQFVRIESSSGETLRLAATVYLLPVVLFLVGYLIQALWGAVGLLLGLAAAFYTNRKLQQSGGITVTVTEILRDGFVDSE